MDWVHCNNCHTQPGDIETKKFFITDCGHIYCNECLQLNQSNECQICHIKYITIPLTSNMNSEVEIYFHDPLPNLKKQVKILEFQQNHRIRLVSHIREKIRNCKSLKKENYNLIEELKLRKKENLALLEELKRVKADFCDLKKKCELLTKSDQLRNLQRTPQPSSFSQFINRDLIKQSPIMTPKNKYQTLTPTEESFNSGLKRPSTSNFFVMSETETSTKNRRNFTTPDLHSFPGSYRSDKILTPDTNTPPTPESFIREFSQRDPLQRKVKLPGSKNSGPRSTSRLGFHGLTLSRPTSTPKKENISNKYLTYFK